MDKLLESITNIWQQVTASISANGDTSQVSADTAVAGTIGVSVVSWLLLIVIVVFIYKNFSAIKYSRFLHSILTYSIIALRFLKYISNSREWRYDRNWALLISDKSQAESALKTYLDKSQKNNILPREAALPALDEEWFFLEQGTVVAPRITSSDTEQGKVNWLSALKRLRQLRSEKPIDSIIFTISLTKICGKDEYELALLAKNLRKQLVDIQEVFGFSIPVYLIFSDVDKVPGFKDYLKVLPASIKTQIFGWSSPYKMDKIYTDDWVDNAFTAIHSSLRQVYFSGWKNVAPADGYYLFPANFLKLKNHIHTVIQNLFTFSTGGAQLMLRGIYFIGQESNLVDQSNQIDDKGEEDVTRRSLFSEDLIRNKIFAENNLAKPTHTSFFSRDTYIRRFQFCTLWLFIFLFGSLMISMISLNKDVNTIQQLMFSVNTWDDKKLDYCDADAVHPVYRLLDQIATIDATPVYWNMPLSWAIINRVPEQVAEQLSNRAFAEIILPNIKCYIESKTAVLANVNNFTQGSHRENLKNYIQAVDDFEINLRRLQTLAPEGRAKDDSLLHAISSVFMRWLSPLLPFQNTSAASSGTNDLACSNRTKSADCPDKTESEVIKETPMTSFIALSSYAFDLTPPASLRNKHGQHQRALVLSNYQPKWKLLSFDTFTLQLDPYCKGLFDGNKNQFGQKNIQQYQQLQGQQEKRPVSKALIAANVCTLVRALEQEIIANSYIGGSADKYDNGLNLTAAKAKPRQFFDDLSAWLTNVNDQWVAQVEAGGPCKVLTDQLGQFTQQLRSFGYSETITEPLRTVISECEEETKKVLVQQHLPEFGSLLQFNEEKRLLVEPAFKAVNDSISELSVLDLEGAPLAEKFNCNSNAYRWDADLLDLVIKQHHRYEAFINNDSFTNTEYKNNPLVDIVDAYMDQYFAAVLNAAQKGVNIVVDRRQIDPLTTMEATIVDKSRRFENVYQMLLSITDILNQMGLSKNLTLLSHCAASYANQALAEIDTLVSIAGIYREIPTALGAIPALDNYQSFIADQSNLDRYLKEQHRSVELIVKYTNPFTAYLINAGNYSYLSQPGETQQVDYWKMTAYEFNKFIQGIDGTNQVVLLDNYLQQVLTKGDLVDNETGPCSNIDSPLTQAYSTDLFSSRRYDITNKLASYCRQENISTIERTYASLAADFNQLLAGQFPFCNTDMKTCQQTADPYTVQMFFKRYADVMDNVVENIALLTKSDNRWLPANQFLQQLQPVYTFFAAMNLLLEDDKSQLSVTDKSLLIDFDFSAYPGSLLASQLINLKVSVQDNAVQLDQMDKPLLWTFGEDIDIDLIWALNADLEPAANTSGAIEPDSHLQSSFSFSGQWALFSLLQQYQKVSEVENQLGVKANSSVVDISLPVNFRKGIPGQTPTFDTNINFQMTLFTKDIKSKKYQPLVLPLKFPAQAAQVVQAAVNR